MGKKSSVASDLPPRASCTVCIALVACSKALMFSSGDLTKGFRVWKPSPYTTWLQSPFMMWVVGGWVGGMITVYRGGYLLVNGTRKN